MLYRAIQHHRAPSLYLFAINHKYYPGDIVLTLFFYLKPRMVMTASHLPPFFKECESVKGGENVESKTERITAPELTVCSSLKARTY